jgi:phage shock protein A
MATLVNRFYTGEYDPNLASGIDTARPLEKLGKQVFHEQPATKVNWQYPWPYTEMIMAQGGKVKPEQFQGSMRASDGFIKSIIMKESLERQKKRIEERMIEVKSDAELDRLIKNYAMGQFKNQMNTRDIQYQLRLLGDDARFADERERLLTEMTTREKYAGLGALTNPQAARFFANQEMFRDAVRGPRENPMPNGGLNAYDAVVEENDMCQARDTTQPLPDMNTPPLSSDETTTRLTPEDEMIQTPMESEYDAQIRAYIDRLKADQEKKRAVENVFGRLEKSVDDSVGELEHTEERRRETEDRSPPANTSDQIGVTKDPRQTAQMTKTNPDEGLEDAGEGTSSGGQEGTYFDSSIKIPEIRSDEISNNVTFRNYSTKTKKGFIQIGGAAHKKLWKRHMRSGRPREDFAWLPDPPREM